MLSNWLNKLLNRKSRSSRRTPWRSAAAQGCSPRPALEALEDRMLMTTGPGVVFDDYGVRPYQLHWQVLAANGEFIDKLWGGAGWTPVAGDWQPGFSGRRAGFGAIQRLDANHVVWYTLSNMPGGTFGFETRQAFYVPGWNQHFLAGDWNGDGFTDYAFTYEDGHADIQWKFYFPRYDYTSYSHFGGLGTTPVAGDWNGDGYDTIGVVNPNGVWQLRDSLSPGAPNYTSRGDE